MWSAASTAFDASGSGSAFASSGGLAGTPIVQSFASAGSPISSFQSNPSDSWFSYEELARATDNFARSNKLGEGGFGKVYRGVLENFKGQAGNTKVVAVKVLTVGGGQGEREFRAEVEIISRVHHRHLVTLLGYCIANEQRLLVYEYVPNGTLDRNLQSECGEGGRCYCVALEGSDV